MSTDPTPNTPEAPQEGLVEAAFRAGHQLGFDAAESTSRSQSGHVEDAWREYCAALTRLPSSILAGEAERLREALMECEWALPVLATMCGAAGLNIGKSRAIEILKDVRAALTPPSSPASAEAGEIVAKRIYRAMVWAVVHRETGEPPVWVEGGNSFAQDEARAAARDIAALSSPSPALRVAEEALDGLIPKNLDLSNTQPWDDGTIVPIDATLGELRKAATALATIRAEQGDAR